MEWTGGCACGAIRYEASEPPNKSGTCHCRICQQWTGSAFWAFTGFPLSAFRFTRGEPKVYRSSPIGDREFCPDCGSSLTLHYLESLGENAKSGPDHIWVAIGSLDHPEAVSLNYHYAVETQLPWVKFDDDLPCTRMNEDPGLEAAYGEAEKKAE
jgi:hypothetical protein